MVDGNLGTTRVAGNPALEFLAQLGKDLDGNNFVLPPFPDTAMRVQRAIAEPDTCIDRLTAIVMSEPALTARLMRMANSAMLRRGPMEITDVKDAIVRIGLRMVQNVAVAFAARQAFPTPGQGPVAKELHKVRFHSLQVASFAYLLGRRIKHGVNADEAMLAGLLHGVGKYYIFMRVADFPELFGERSLLEALLAKWHTGVARAIVEAWGFPARIVQAVDEHEELARKPRPPADTTDIVLVANLIVLGQGREQPLAALDNLPSLARMGTTVEEVAQVLATYQAEVESMLDALSG